MIISPAYAMINAGQPAGKVDGSSRGSHFRRCKIESKSSKALHRMPSTARFFGHSRATEFPVAWPFSFPCIIRSCIARFFRTVTDRLSGRIETPAAYETSGKTLKRPWTCPIKKKKDPSRAFESSSAVSVIKVQSLDSRIARAGRERDIIGTYEFPRSTSSTADSVFLSGCRLLSTRGTFNVGYNAAA
jgi:hypothetical protein